MHEIIQFQQICGVLFCFARIGMLPKDIHAKKGNAFLAAFLKNSRLDWSSSF